MRLIRLPLTNNRTLYINPLAVSSVRHQAEGNLTLVTAMNGEVYECTDDLAKVVNMLCRERYPHRRDNDAN